MSTISLLVFDAERQPPDELEDVLVFGQLGDEEPDWHIGYRRSEDGGAPVWCLTDTSVPPLEFRRVIAWAQIPPDPRPETWMRAVA